MANHFSGDIDCVALWRMESGALTTDSKGTNTLTNNNAVVADTVNFKEGAASADFEVNSSQYFSITDTNLNAGFPLKSGDTNKIISVSLWFRAESLPAVDGAINFFSKSDGSTPKRSFQTCLVNLSNVVKIYMILGFNSGASAELIAHATVPDVGTWYHVTFSYYNSDKSYAIRLRDINGAVVGTDLTGTATLDANKLSVTDTALFIGASNPPTPVEFFDGLIDEVVVFKDIITADEATLIAKGLYGNLLLLTDFMGGDCNRMKG